MNRNKINELIAKIKENMTLTEYINFVDLELTDSFIDLIADLEINIYKYLEEIALLAYANSDNIDLLENSIFDINNKLDDFDLDNVSNINKNNDKIDNLMTKLSDMGSEYSKIINKSINDNTVLLLDRLKIYSTEVTNLYLNKEDAIYKRVMAFQLKLSKMADSLCVIDILAVKKHRENLKRLDNILKRIDIERNSLKNKIEKNNLELELLKKNIKKDNKKQKIFDYKELNSLAEKNGYIYRNYNGDHKVYIHQKSNKIVVIPQHTIGYGLSMEIQNQIKINAIVKAA